MNQETQTQAKETIYPHPAEHRADYALRLIAAAQAADKPVCGWWCGWSVVARLSDTTEGLVHYLKCYGGAGVVRHPPFIPCHDCAAPVQDSVAEGAIPQCQECRQRWMERPFIPEALDAARAALTDRDSYVLRRNDSAPGVLSVTVGRVDGGAVPGHVVAAVRGELSQLVPVSMCMVVNSERAAGRKCEACGSTDGAVSWKWSDLRSEVGITTICYNCRCVRAGNEVAAEILHNRRERIDLKLLAAGARPDGAMPYTPPASIATRRAEAVAVDSRPKEPRPCVWCEEPTRTAASVTRKIDGEIVTVLSLPTCSGERCGEYCYEHIRRLTAGGRDGDFERGETRRYVDSSRRDVGHHTAEQPDFVYSQKMTGRDLDVAWKPKRTTAQVLSEQRATLEARDRRGELTKPGPVAVFVSPCDPEGI